MDLREQPPALAQISADLRVKAEKEAGFIFARRLGKSILIYPFILFLLWTGTDYRHNHLGTLLTVSVLILVGTMLRQYALSARERIWLQSPERWYDLIAVTAVVLAGSFGFLLAHAIADYGFGNSNFEIVMIWNTGLAAGSIVSLSPNTKIFRVQVIGLLLPPLAAACWLHTAVAFQYALGNVALCVFSFVQGKQIAADFWEQLINHFLEDKRREEIESARRTAEGALLTAAEARQAARVRSEFLANMSHEIRTPINAVVGMTSLLLDQGLPPETIDCVNTIRSSSDALLALIGDILDFSKIESGKLELEYEAFCLRDCVEEVLELVVNLAAEKKLELAARIDPQVSEWVYGDVTRTRQILLNLAGNAVKFTAQGEVVVVAGLRSREEGNKMLHLAVSDTGIGIPAEKIGALFQAFTQIDSSSTRQYGGAGLGLAISKRLTELMGGRIWVTSQFGNGSIFQLEIPYQAAPDQEIPAAACEDWRNKRILVVDDNETSRLILTSQLNRWDLTSRAVASGKEAMAAMRTELWDAALLDWQMPEMDGAKLALAVKQEFGNSAPPMIMLCPGAISAQKLFGGDASPLAAILSKPARRLQLQRALGQVLNGMPARQSASAGKIFELDFATRFPLRILLAEDNPVNQKVAVRTLERLGYLPDVANNGLETLEALRRQTYDMVLTDVHMPQMNGLDATRQIVSSWGADRPWITALTASTLIENRDECFAAGMDDFLAKPINVQELKAALERCFNNLTLRPRRSVSADQSVVIEV